jgi:beta-lactamase class A/beta-lactamase class A VEB
LLTVGFAQAQSIEGLRHKIKQVLKGKAATVGVAIQGANPTEAIAVNGDKHLPMQSVYKFHLALAVLHQVDQGKFKLSQKMTISQKMMDTYKKLWSPLRKKYPNGVTLTLAKIIEYTVAWSDNLGCDLLFELVGGTKAVEAYMHKIGVKDIAIVYPEIIMQARWSTQYDNWTTAKAANQVLALFFKNSNKLLSTQSHNFLLGVLKGSQTGKKSIRGFLPKETVVAHKTGYSGKNKKGVIGALNDIGIVFLPNGTHFYISVLVSNSSEGYAASQKIIADVAKLAWDYFNKK